MNDDSNDEMLIESHYLGDKEALGQLHNKYRGRLEAYFKSRGHLAQTDAEDLVSEVFLKIIGTTSRWDRRHGASFRTWLFIIANGVLSNYLHKRTQPVSLDTEEGPSADQLESSVLPPPAQLMADEFSLRLNDRIDLLSAPQRQVLRLHLAHLSLPEIAAILNIRYGTAGRQLSEARKVMAALMHCDSTELPSDSMFLSQIATCFDRRRETGRTLPKEVLDLLSKAVENQISKAKLFLQDKPFMWTRAGVEEFTQFRTELFESLALVFQIVTLDTHLQHLIKADDLNFAFPMFAELIWAQTERHDAIELSLRVYGSVQGRLNPTAEYYVQHNLFRDAVGAAWGLIGAMRRADLRHVSHRRSSIAKALEYALANGFRAPFGFKEDYAALKHCETANAKIEMIRYGLGNPLEIEQGLDEIPADEEYGWRVALVKAANVGNAANRQDRLLTPQLESTLHSLKESKGANESLKLVIRINLEALNPNGEYRGALDDFFKLDHSYRVSILVQKLGWVLEQTATRIVARSKQVSSRRERCDIRGALRWPNELVATG